MTTPAHPRRPFPWALLRNWLAVYLPPWILMAAVIFIIQTVLAAMLHDREDLRAFLQLLDRAPKIFKAFLGGSELMPGNVNGIIAIGYQHPLVLILLMVNAALIPSGLLTGQAEHGTMELLLARPLTRGRVFVMTVALASILEAGLAFVIFSGTAVWTNVFDYGQPVPLQPFFIVTCNVAASGMAVVGLVTLAGAYFDQRNRAVGVVIGYLVGSYLLDFSAVWWPRLEVVHPWTLFYYCVPNAVLKLGGIPWRNFIVLGSIYAGSLTAAWFIWRRRDLAAA